MPGAESRAPAARKAVVVVHSDAEVERLPAALRNEVVIVKPYHVQAARLRMELDREAHRSTDDAVAAIAQAMPLQEFLESSSTPST
ncbi:MAG: hypothetical protein ACOYXW_07940 [Actinomycetota bacterium]